MSGTQIRLDTHIVVWLYAGDSTVFSADAAELIDASELVITPMVELELDHLYEIGRLSERAAVVVNDLSQRVGLRRSEQSFASVVAAASTMSRTRDPFDRLIVGDAAASGTQLLTKDRRILEQFPAACW